MHLQDWEIFLSSSPDSVGISDHLCYGLEPRWVEDGYSLDLDYGNTLQNECAVPCPTYYFYQSGEDSCLRCEQENCVLCAGACLECKESYYLHDGQCLLVIKFFLVLSRAEEGRTKEK